MDKLKILIVDDDGPGLKIIRKYISLYFRDPSLLSVDEDSMAVNAIQRIENSEQPYDLIFTDLEFSATEDTDANGNRLNGKDIIVAAANRFPTNQTAYFTVSGKRGFEKTAILEEELAEKNIYSYPLLKDQGDERVIKAIDQQLKKWTEYNLSIGIPHSQKTKFYTAIAKKKLDAQFKVFNWNRQLRILLLYWLNKNEDLTINKILEQFPNVHYDLPNISFEKLFRNIGLAPGKFDHYLVNYYKEFYDFHIKDLPALLAKAEHYLDKLAALYELTEHRCEDSINDCGVRFQDQFIEFHKELRDEDLSIQGNLEDPASSTVMVKFKKRLWFRLFCLGAYYIDISKLDIYRLLGTTFSRENDTVTDINLRVFSRSLWLDSFRKQMDIWERDYDKVNENLCDYEKQFLKTWLKKIIALKDDGLPTLYKVRKLDEIFLLLNKERPSK